jgi:hypothetical protein
VFPEEEEPLEMLRVRIESILDSKLTEKICLPKPAPSSIAADILKSACQGRQVWALNPSGKEPTIVVEHKYSAGVQSGCLDVNCERKKQVPYGYRCGLEDDSTIIIAAVVQKP